MGFKLPDLDGIGETPKPSESKHLYNEHTNTRQDEQTVLNHRESDANRISERKLTKDVPSPIKPLEPDNLSRPSDDVKDLTDDDLDAEITRELENEKDDIPPLEPITPPHDEKLNDDSIPEEFLNGDLDEKENILTGKGIINTVEERNGEYRIMLRKDLQSNEIFYLDKEITGDEFDTELSAAKAGTPIEFEYDDNKSYNRNNVRVHIVRRMLKFDKDNIVRANNAPVNEPIPEPEQPKEPKPKREHHFWKTLLKWNDAIGNFLYKVIDFILRWTFYRLPFMGRFLLHTKIVWKIFCRFWSVILIAGIIFFFNAGQIHAKGMYEVRKNGTELRIDKIRFSNKTDDVTMNVANKGKTYAYYYLNVKIHEQGIIPYIGGKDIECQGPSTGQAIDNVQKMTLQCNAPKTNPHASYKFEIVNTQ